MPPRTDLGWYRWNRILAHLRANDHLQTTQMIADDLGMTYQQVYVTARGLWDRGLITCEWMDGRRYWQACVAPEVIADIEAAFASPAFDELKMPRLSGDG